MISTRRLALVVVLSISAAAVASVNAIAQDQEWQSSQVLGVPPAGADMFQLNDLDAFKKYSRVKNFEIVGHAYLRAPARARSPDDGICIPGQCATQPDSPVLLRPGQGPA